MRCSAAADRSDLDALLAQWQSSRARACIAQHALSFGNVPREREGLLQRELRRAEMPSAYMYAAASLRRAGRVGSAIEELERGITRSAHPRDRIMLTVTLVDYLRADGKRQQAAKTQAALDAAVNRGPPAARYWLAVWKANALSGDALDRTARDAAAVTRRHGAVGLCANILYQAGGVHVDRGDPRRAIRLLEEGEACARGAAPYYRMITAGRYGRALFKAGRYDDAIVTLGRAANLARAERSRHYLAEALHNLTHAYEGKGDMARARQSAIAYVAAADSLERSSLRIISLRDAGIVFWNSDQRAAARRFFERMVRRIDTEEQEFHWAAEYYERAGDMPNARKYYVKSLSVAADSARKYAGLTRVYLALAEMDSAEVTARLHDHASPQTPEEVPLLPYVYMARGRHAEAITTAVRNAARQAGRDNIAGAVHGYTQAASLAYMARSYAQAARWAAVAHQHAQRSNDRQGALRALTLLAASQSANGEHAASRQSFARLLADARRYAEPLVHADAYAALGAARVREQQYDAALAAFDSATRMRSRVVERFEDEFDRVRFQAPFADAFEDVLADVAATGNAVRLHEWLQRRKRAASPRPLSYLARTLGERAAAIDYIVTDAFVGGVVITRDTAFVFRSPIDRQRLALLVQRMRRAAEPHFGRIDFSRARYDYEAARELYDALLRPVESVIAPKFQWYISADDQLQLVAFDALVKTGTGASARFVIDDHEIVHTLSTSYSVPGPTARAQRVVLVTADAPGTAAEVTAIRRHVPVQLIEAATEGAVSRALDSAAVIHFAVHGEANVDQPTQSHLRLTAGAGDDGLYHVSEIRRARTRAGLVVLTACETVGSRLYGGDGGLSVARSFLAAGARSVLATQWSIGSTAAEFSDSFYAHLRGGGTAAAAVRAAKLQLRRQPGSNPLVWAPFILIVGAAS